MKTIIVGVFVALLLLLVAITPANSATRYVEEPFGGVNLLGEAGKDVKSWVPRHVPDRSYQRKYKKPKYAKSINQAKKRKVKKAKKSGVIRRYVEKQRAKKRARKKEFYEVKPTRSEPTYSAPVSKPQIKAAMPPPIPEIAPAKETLYEEPTLLYDPESDETPLTFHEGPGVVKPYQPNIFERIRQWWNSRKRADKKEELDFLTQKREGVSIVAVVKDWYNTAMAKFTKKKEVPEKVEVAEADPCGVIRWMVPNNISSIGLRILNRDGSVASQFTISNYITVNPGQSFQLVPRCR